MKKPSDDADRAIAALVPAFLQKRLAELDELAKMAEEQDWAWLLEHSHRLKGVGLPYGFAQISAFGDELTGHAQRQDGTAAMQCIANYAVWLRGLRAAASHG